MTNATLSSGPAAGRGRIGTARPTAGRTAVGRTAPDRITSGRITSGRPTWSARLLIAGGLAMVPWLVYLAATLPSGVRAAHWDAVWVGFDTAEAAGLLATGCLLRLGDSRRSLTAAATATLLAVDAWFDCGTAATGADRFAALAMALGLELPLAVFLGVLAWRAFPRATGTAR